jgi:hypothetical protein
MKKQVLDPVRSGHAVRESKRLQCASDGESRVCSYIAEIAHSDGQNGTVTTGRDFCFRLMIPRVRARQKIFTPILNPLDGPS